MTTGALIVFGLSLAWAAASPAGATAPAGDFLACAGERDDARRLACFDAAVVHVGKQGATQAAAAAPGAAPISLSNEEKFGLRGELKQEKAKKAPELHELEQLQAQVMSVSSKPHGELVITLENGQVWTEIQTNSGARVKSGDRVAIKAGTLGSYLLVAPNGRSTRVTRIR